MTRKRVHHNKVFRRYCSGMPEFWLVNEFHLVRNMLKYNFGVVSDITHYVRLGIVKRELKSRNPQLMQKINCRLFKG